MSRLQKWLFSMVGIVIGSLVGYGWAQIMDGYEVIYSPKNLIMGAVLAAVIITIALFVFEEE